MISTAGAPSQTPMHSANSTVILPSALVPPGDTTADHVITLEFAECLGACEGAPCVLVNDEHRMNVTRDKADELVAELRR